MAVNDHSLRALYLAQTKTSQRLIPFWRKDARVDVVQECEPWRRGHARMIPTLVFKRAVLIGWWKPYALEFDSEDEAEMFGDDQWLDPKKVFVQPDVIGDWDDGRSWNMGLDEQGGLEQCCPTDDACEMHRGLEGEDDVEEEEAVAPEPKLS